MSDNYLNRISRRDWLKLASAAGLGTLTYSESAFAQEGLAMTRPDLPSCTCFGPGWYKGTEPAKRNAENTNPKNRAPTTHYTPGSRGYQIAVDRNLRWPQRDLVKYGYFDKSKLMKSYIEQAIRTWAPLTGLEFKEVAFSDADIRIGFLNGQGHFSLLGQEARRMRGGWGSTNRDNNQLSMNIDPEEDPKHLLRVCLHEFGHAVGCIHEHQRTELKLEFVRGELERYYQNNFGFGPDLVRSQILDRYSGVLQRSPKADPKSIMTYPLPLSVYRKGGENFVVDDFVKTLSPDDRRFTRVFYNVSSSSNDDNDDNEDHPRDDDDHEPIISKRQEQRDALDEDDAKTLKLKEAVSLSFTEDRQFYLYKLSPGSAGDGYILEAYPAEGKTDQLAVTLEVYKEGPFDPDENTPMYVSGLGKGQTLLSPTIKADFENRTYYLVVLPTLYGQTGDCQVRFWAKEDRLNEEKHYWQARKTEINEIHKEIEQRQTELNSKLDKLPKLSQPSQNPPPPLPASNSPMGPSPKPSPQQT